MRYWLLTLRPRKKSRFYTRRVRTETGFTLVETLVVAVIFSIIAAGLSASFLSGMKIWARAQKINLAQNELLINLEKITKELRQSLNIAVIGFEGNAGEISFPELIGNNIMKVTYKFDSDNKMLLRSQVDLKDILEEEEAGEGEDGDEEADKEDSGKNIMALEGFSLSYLYFDSETSTYVWTDVWAKDKGIFNAVKLEIKTKDEEVTKTVFIPAVN